MEFIRDYTKNPMTDEDLITLLGVNEEKTLSEAEMATNRALVKALFLAEEMKSTINIEKNGNAIKITICKDA